MPVDTDCWGAKVRVKKGEFCSYAPISIDFSVYFSDWFYPRPQIEPIEREKDYWNFIIPTVLFYVFCQMATSLA